MTLAQKREQEQLLTESRRLWAEQVLREPRYRSIALANCANREHVEDALQDTALLALRHLSHDHPNPEGWLTLTLKRRCWAMYRRKRDEPIEPIPLSDALAERPYRLPEPQCYDDTAALSRFEAALQSLKPQERAALGDRLAGYSYKAICRRRGWTYTKVNRCITEGTARLRALLEPA